MSATALTASCELDGVEVILWRYLTSVLFWPLLPLMFLLHVLWKAVARNA